MGLAAACQFGPLLVFGLKAGALVENLDRYRLLRRLSAGLSAVVASMGLLALLGALGIASVLALTALFGAISAVESPTRRAFTADLVPPERAGTVLALSSSVLTSARMLGPALAALVAARIGTGSVFVLNAASFCALVGLLGLLHSDDFHRAEPGPRSPRPVRDGLTAVWSIAELRPIIVVFGAVSLLAYNHRVGLPLLITDRLLRPDRFYGWLLSAMSVGNVTGALLVSRLRDVRAGLPVGSAFCVGGALAAIAITRNGVTALVLACILGLGMSAFSNSSIAMIQTRVSPAVRSRALSLTTVLFTGSTPIGGMLTGYVGDSFGAVWSNLYGAIGTLVAATVAVLFLAREHRVNGT